MCVWVVDYVGSRIFKSKHLLVLLAYFVQVIAINKSLLFAHSSR